MLKKKLLSGVFAALCLSQATAFAEEQYDWQKPVNNDKVILGVEGFDDHYREPVVDVTENATFGALDVGYIHNFKKYFVEVEGRASYGHDDYESPSGHLKGVPQYELEGRTTFGGNWNLGSGVIAPYSGLGLRHFVDEGKGKVTELNAFAYDRRITQLYAPIGLSYTVGISDDWYIAPNFEYDAFIWGNVNSRLQNGNQYFIGDPYYNIDNTQDRGYGLRGEFMFVTKPDETGLSWQFGPFFRYWKAEDSDLSTEKGLTGLEPKNTRMQIGASVKAIW
ncbi:MAG: hypothetical protein WCL30_03265 [Pseudomonadota bacterium]